MVGPALLCCILLCSAGFLANFVCAYGQILLSCPVVCCSAFVLCLVRLVGLMVGPSLQSSDVMCRYVCLNCSLFPFRQYPNALPPPFAVFFRAVLLLLFPCALLPQGPEYKGEGEVLNGRGSTGRERMGLSLVPYTVWALPGKE